MPTTKKALSLVEIIISMLIFSLIMGGLVSLFMASRRHILRSRSWMVQGELAKYFLDPLQMEVRQDQWVGPPTNDYLSTNPLHKRVDDVGSSINLDGVDYTPTYTVDVPPGFSSDSPMRKVRLTVSYPVEAYE